MKNSLISFILIFSVSVSASQDNIREGLKNILPDGAVIELIEPSPIPGIYAVYYGDLQPIYVTQDGSFFIYGDIYKINTNSISNITDLEVSKTKSLLNAKVNVADVVGSSILKSEKQTHIKVLNNILVYNADHKTLRWVLVPEIRFCGTLRERGAPGSVTTLAC